MAVEGFYDEFIQLVVVIVQVRGL